MNQPNDKNNQSLSIGSDATGNIIQSGNGNFASLQFTQTTLPPSESVDIKSELASLRELLGKLNSEYEKKIDRAFEDANDEVAKSEPNRDEVGDALARALSYAKKAEGFADMAVSIKDHTTNIVSWLGNNWHKLLSVVGLTL